ncbi:hypothetical protein I7I48_05422 [Histoplasma ohiense]|nr:hypothetical protein I7I48_05422 [Histoplasma ohiense (nom. inval.)]
MVGLKCGLIESHAWNALQKIDKRDLSLIHQGPKPCPSCLKARTLKVERRSGEQWEVWCRRTTAMTMRFCFSLLLFFFTFPLFTSFSETVYCDI